MNPGVSHLDKERLERLLGIGLRALEKYQRGMFRMNAPGACSGEAVCRASREGECAVGRIAERFTLMSAVKPFLLLRLLDLQGEAQVAEWVDDVPSALPYYSLEQLQADGGKPRNAMINRCQQSSVFRVGAAVSHSANRHPGSGQLGGTSRTPLLPLAALETVP